MKVQEELRVLIAVLVIVLLPVAVWAQVTAPATPSASSGASSGGAGAGMVIGVVLALLIVVGIGVKMYDLKRKRDAEAVHLQAQVSDALLRESTLFGLPITPTVHVPTWKGSPAKIEVA